MPVVLENENGLKDNFTLDIDETYSMNKWQILTSNVVAVDNLGVYLFDEEN